jgi:hypothetical protein
MWLRKVLIAMFISRAICPVLWPATIRCSTCLSRGVSFRSMFSRGDEIARQPGSRENPESKATPPALIASRASVIVAGFWSL